MTEKHQLENPANPEPVANPEAESASQLVEVLREIRDELRAFNRNFQRVIEPEVVLNHFTRGASLRVDDSHTRTANPTF